MILIICNYTGFIYFHEGVPSYYDDQSLFHVHKDTYIYIYMLHIIHAYLIFFAYIYICIYVELNLPSGKQTLQLKVLSLF